jgi:hypothetical protein
VYDEEYFRTVAMHRYPEAFAELLRQPRRTGPQRASWKATGSSTSLTLEPKDLDLMIRSIAPR